MGIIWQLFCWAVMVYLVGRVAYNEGRKAKWEEMCKEYICIHKSVCIKPCEKGQKTLDKISKKKYNKKAYKQQHNVKP